MKALTYLLGRSLINEMKTLRRKPGKLILVIFAALIIGMMIVTSSMDQSVPTDILADSKGAVLTLLTLLAAWFTVKGGMEKGSTFYRMADVNFVFPAPIKPRHILLYGFVHQLGVSLLTLVFLLFQLYNVRNLFGMGPGGVSVFYLAVFLSLLFIPLGSMLLYSKTLNHPLRKRLIRRILTGALILLGALYVAAAIRLQDPLAAAAAVFDHPAVDYIPLIGWFRAVLMASVYGWTAYRIASLALIAAALCGTLWWLLASDPDYYEDVLKQTEQRETLIREKRAGHTKMVVQKVHAARWRYRGWGASALFHRQMLEYRKAGFLFLDKISLFLAVAAVAAGYLLRGNSMQPYYLFYGSIYILFIFSFSGKWMQELARPYIYLIPASSMARIWYATLANHLKHLTDGLVVFTIAGIIAHIHPATCLLLALQYMGFGALFTYADVLFRRWFGSLSNSLAAGFLRLFIILALAVPALAMIIVSGVLAPGSQLLFWGAQAAAIGYSALVSFLIMLLGRRLFENLELAQ